MSFEDYMIYRKIGQTITSGFFGWFQKIIAQVRRALLIGETKTMSTSKSLTIYLAFSACQIPSSVVQTSRQTCENLLVRYSQVSLQLGPYFSSNSSLTLLNPDFAWRMKWSMWQSDYNDFRSCILKLGYRLKKHYLLAETFDLRFFVLIQIRISLCFKLQDFQQSIDIVLMQSDKNKEQNQLQSRSISNKPTKEQLKLPYLKLNQPMKPLQYKKSQSQHNRSLQHTFDLHTNYAAIPRYEASKDTNLVYFFNKPSNKKIIDELKQLQTVTKRKQPNTQRPHNQSISLHATKGVRAVSKNDFDSYLTKMKARVSSSTLQI